MTVATAARAALALGAACLPLRALVAQPRTLADTIGRFDATVAAAAEAWNVPGLSIAVVRDGRVLFSKGYGVRQLGADAPVTDQTLFGIMSTTKAMTAVTLAMLVDEKRLRWSDPVAQWLPELVFPAPLDARTITVRELLTHNTGLGNADLLWARGDLPAAEIYRRVRFLTPAYTARAGFVYQNVMYGAAGLLIERITGKPYATVLQERIFTPLGMTRTRATYGAVVAARDTNVSRAHYRIRDTVRVIAEDTVDALPAAGAVWSTASDMARWARFLLDSGRVDGKRLLSERGIAAIFAPHVIVPPAEFYPTTARTRPHWTTYGLGWFQQDFRGRMLQFHTGSLDGRTAIIGLVPDRNVGVVVLGNLDHAEVRHALMLQAIDLFAGTNGEPARDWSAELKALYDGLARAADSTAASTAATRTMETRPSLPLTRYAGRYEHPVWGMIDVTVDGDALIVQAGAGASNRARMAHWQYDTFRGEFGDGRGGASTARFTVDERGIAATMTFFGSEGYTFRRVAMP
ncbi:MAG: serine hydrolase [Gemmatimonadaceae bacterium]|jgi:CubicO group peptidase (beta-lactamase class C family)|nr:serine hydrolase [Gemmatimonadaceae bacterium]